MAEAASATSSCRLRNCNPACSSSFWAWRKPSVRWFRISSSLEISLHLANASRQSGCGCSAGTGRGHRLEKPLRRFRPRRGRDRIVARKPLAHLDPGAKGQRHFPVDVPDIGKPRPLRHPLDRRRQFVAIAKTSRLLRQPRQHERRHRTRPRLDHAVRGFGHRLPQLRPFKARDRNPRQPICLSRSSCSSHWNFDQSQFHPSSRSGGRPVSERLGVDRQRIVEARLPADC